MAGDETPLIIDVVAEPADSEGEAAPERRSLVVARELLPDTLPIVPLPDRPLFPKMMGPILVAGEELRQEIVERLGASRLP